MYTDFYKLRAEPFLLTPDERFYFESSVHSEAMAHLVYGLKRGEGFIVITGEVGAGKTTLVKRLIATINHDEIIAAHIVTTSLSGNDLLRIIASAFGLRDLPTDKSGVLVRLQEFFEATYKQGRRALLIVDEAQNLSEAALEEMRMLSNFQIGHAAPLQSFLVGQPQFRRIIASPDLEQLRQRVIASYHLGPLNVAETGTYISHRLERVGWQNDPAFDQEAIEALHRRTGGIPRRINALGNRLMILGFLDELHRFTAQDVDRIAADLAKETEEIELPTGASQIDAPQNGAFQNGHANAHGLANGALEARLADIERQLSTHDSFINRADSVIRSFLGFVGGLER